MYSSRLQQQLRLLGQRRSSNAASSRRALPASVLMVGAATTTLLQDSSSRRYNSNDDQSWFHRRRHSSKAVSRLEGNNNNNNNNNNDDGTKEREVFRTKKNWDKDFWNSLIFTGEKDEDSATTTAAAGVSGGGGASGKDPIVVKGKEAIPLEAMVFDSMRKIIGLNNNQNDNHQKDKNPSKKSKEKDDSSATTTATAAGSFQEMAASFATLLAGGGTEESVQRIVKQARESAEEGDVADKKSLEEMMTLLQQYAENLKKTADKFLGDVDLTKLYPTSLFYFVEFEDAVKNPSWKRRMHRFFPGIDLSQMEELNDYLQLAELSYADTVEQIRHGLEHHKTTPYEVVLVDTNSTPNRPAHFIAVKRSQQFLSPYLEVLLCVRGTKTIEDAMADILCDYEPYRNGKAHSGVLSGGKVLAQEHKPLLLQLLKSSGKHQIKLTCVGHSLGAGCASIIGMEYNDDPNFEINVIGFGCPALLSKELSEQTKSYITTVVADDDCVPRLSAASVVNACLDIMEYDYLPSARRDVKHAFQELQRLFPAIVTKSLTGTIIDFLDPLLDQFLGEAIKERTTKRMEPVLFPPGNIIHFYRDGVGVTGSVVPCDFFSELHISRRMVDDHLFFTGYQQIFLELMRQQHQDHYFSFDHGDDATTGSEKR